MLGVVRDPSCCVGRIDASAQTTGSAFGFPLEACDNSREAVREPTVEVTRAANVSLWIECARERRSRMDGDRRASPAVRAVGWQERDAR